AAAAVEQDSLLRRAASSLGGEELGKRNSLRVAPSLVALPGSLSHQQPGCVEIRRHVCQHCLDHLKVADALPELPPLTREVDAGIETCLQDANGSGRYPQPSMVQRSHRHLEPLTRFTENRVVS